MRPSSSIRPELIDRTLALAASHGLRIRYLLDTHTHADHFSAVSELRLDLMHTPGHTRDSLCVVVKDRVLTGDTLLLGGAGRTDLPTGDPEALYGSLFQKLLKLDGSFRVYPAHNYKNIAPTTLDEQRKTNPRLRKTERADFVEMMQTLSMSMPEPSTVL